MSPMIPTPGDYRTAGGHPVNIVRIGKRGRWAFNYFGGKWNAATGAYVLHDRALNITGPWVAEPAPTTRPSLPPLWRCQRWRRCGMRLAML